MTVHYVQLRLKDFGGKPLLTALWCPTSPLTLWCWCLWLMYLHQMQTFFLRFHVFFIGILAFIFLYNFLLVSVVFSRPPFSSWLKYPDNYCMNFHKNLHFCGSQRMNPTTSHDPLAPTCSHSQLWVKRLNNYWLDFFSLRRNSNNFVDPLILVVPSSDQNGNFSRLWFMTHLSEISIVWS